MEIRAAARASKPSGKPLDNYRLAGVKVKNKIYSDSLTFKYLLQNFGLREVARNIGVAAYMVDNASQLDAAWLRDKKCIGVTAGASAPEVLVRQVIERLRELGAAEVSELNGKAENISFPLPKALQGD
jgi:hypothetical protein